MRHAIYHRKWVGVLGAALAVGLIQWTAPVARADDAGKIEVVAAENFYGDLATQLGGNHVHVVSIMSDPNIDPHEYEADPKDAIAVAKANIVIQNGADYDNWMPQLLGASPNASRVVLTGAELSHDLLKENPHVWYSLKNVRDIAAAIVKTYETLDAADTGEYEHNLQTFDDSLKPIEEEMESIRHDFSATPVGLTETIYLYQTGPMELNVLTPWEFQHAIAEGNDPPVQSIAAANAQVSGHEIKVLICNVQTITPITTHLQQEAKDANIPIVGVSETMPLNASYQSWMLSQLQTLHTALKSSAK
ncbi:MAG: zinc ABC transporter substrate-binding protein [Tepidisphaeraceae bacterium]